MEINQVLEERGNNYGSFKDNAELSQALKESVRYFAGYKDLTYAQSEAIDNICQKMARIINGDSNYEDNWVDIIGYSQLALNEIKNSKTIIGTLKL